MKELAAFVFLVFATVANCKVDLSDPNQFTNATYDHFVGFFTGNNSEVHLNKYFQLLDPKLEYTPCHPFTRGLKHYKNVFKSLKEHLSLLRLNILKYEYTKDDMTFGFLMDQTYRNETFHRIAFSSKYYAKKVMFFSTRKNSPYKIYRIVGSFVCPPGYSE